MPAWNPTEGGQRDGGFDENRYVAGGGVGIFGYGES